ncbi:ferredoxin [Naegleria gruberi]|uniref:Ferredoxin n=1 Tax=Naegleria gruberi TaxID=5762 RepID=D2VZA5_NAEGR|nr:ferredoxin [Naegleria gruberi]EFC37812.1 ferredoxin [Naegleria gruberi]|eukprot:XP_002670556.1 ferredoxin [Naegleria gruberi]
MDKVVNITVFDREGKVHQVPAYVGETLMDSIRRAGINLVPDSTCLGECACVGCHVIVSNDHEHKLTQCSEDEAEILEDAPFVHENSRLACQIIVDKSIAGLVLALPQSSTDESLDPYFRF